MKILHLITNTDLGGAQKVAGILCNKAVENGHQVALASMPDGPFWDTLSPKVKQFKVKNLIKPISFIPDLKSYFEIKKIIKDFKPDILQLHSSKAGFLGRMAGRKIKKHIVYTVHGFDSVRIKNRKFLFIEKIMQKECGAIIPVSFYDEKNLIKEKITSNIVCIPNGIDKNELNIVTNDEIKQKIINSKNKGNFNVISIARISKQKKFEMFLKVAEKLVKDNINFFWVGTPTDPEEEIKYNNLIKNNKIPSNVYLLGEVQNAGAYIQFADLFVLFSNYEGLPITIIEALASGKPVIASYVGGIPELIENNKNGFLINSIDEAVEKILIISRNKTLLKEMGDNSFNKFEANYTLDKMYNSYMELYSKLLDI